MKDPRDLIVAGGGSLSDTGFCTKHGGIISSRESESSNVHSTIAVKRIQHTGATL